VSAQSLLQPPSARRQSRQPGAQPAPTKDRPTPAAKIRCSLRYPRLWHPIRHLVTDQAAIRSQGALARLVLGEDLRAAADRGRPHETIQPPEMATGSNHLVENARGGPAITFCYDMEDVCYHYVRMSMGARNGAGAFYQSAPHATSVRGRRAACRSRPRRALPERRRRGRRRVCWRRGRRKSACRASMRRRSSRSSPC
jgi:hypothetical protein